ncbi:MAG: type 1 glutamine amidotransferase [Ferrovibrionaceae bacterium]
MNAPHILVLQNSPAAPAGIVGDALVDAGARLDTRLVLDGEALPAALDGYHGILVLGGPMGAHDDDRHPALADQAALIARAAAAGMPLLGICLGGQLMARAAGAPVGRAETPEIGFTRLELLPEAADDPLFASLGPPPAIMELHFDTFATPDGATRLLASADCANQAFRWGHAQYGLQFHPEVDAAIVRTWLEKFIGTPSPVIAGAVAAVPAQIERHMAEADAYGRALARRWLDLALQPA